jgi:hypothetical protein
MRSFGAFFVGPFFIVFEIKIPSIVRAGYHAVPAPNAAVMIYNDNAIITLISSLNWTNLGAGWIFAMVTQQNHGFFGGLRTDFTLDADFPNPVYIPPFISDKSYVVFLPARFHTGGAARLAFSEIDDHPPFSPTRWYINLCPGRAGGGQELESIRTGDC